MDQPPPSLGVGLVRALLTELHVAILRADADLRVVTCTAELGEHLQPLGLDPTGLQLTDLFPELIGSEEELAAVARGQVGRFDLPKINRPDPDSDARRYLSLTAFPDPIL